MGVLLVKVRNEKTVESFRKKNSTKTCNFSQRLICISKLSLVSGLSFRGYVHTDHFVGVDVTSFLLSPVNMRVNQ
jgi:hypothetical protein